MRRIIAYLAFCLGFGAWLHAVDPVVFMVQAQQRAGTKLVDISYTLVDPSSATLNVTIAISSDGGTTWTVPCTHASGNGIGAAVTPGLGKAIVWDAAADWNGQWSEHMRVKVTAADSAVLPAGDYLVIDVSGGLDDGAIYWVTGLTGVPAGGWTDEYRTTKIVLRRVPGAHPYIFTMGSPIGEMGGHSDETQHQVMLTQPFYVGVFEVTQKQWERVMGDWPSYFSNWGVRDVRPVEQVPYIRIRGSSVGAASPLGNAVDAGSFLGRLRARTHPGLATLDLPTEAQWEYACRAGTATALNNGANLFSVDQDDNMDILGRYWYNGGSDHSTWGGLDVGTAKGGTYLANAWGLYDMHGNVWEWCRDWYGTYPEVAVDPVGPSSGVAIVTRGGGWDYQNAGNCRSGCRGGYSDQHRGRNGGFRVALPIGP